MVAAAVRALGLLSPQGGDLGVGAGVFAASGIGRHSWTGGQYCGEVHGVFTCGEEREFAGGVGILPSHATPKSRVKLRGSSLTGLAGPWDTPLASLQCLLPSVVSRSGVLLEPLWEPMPTRRKQTLGPSAPGRTCGEGWPDRLHRACCGTSPPPPNSVRLCAGWEVVRKKVSFSVDCSVVSASSRGPATSPSLPSLVPSSVTSF